jgi:A/G-specific adenine glycosylase
MEKFRRRIYDHYGKYARNLPWRNTRDPYRILVSEIMLQQTQVSRVLQKYAAFIHRFPTLEALSKAPFRDIMRVWQGLGYNRRAVALKKIAEKIMIEFKGIIPSERELLKTLPGIGEATSGAVCAFAFNKPVVFIETNIRSVFIDYFFKDARGVSDAQLIPYLEETLDKKNPRTWYYALMDYGVYLKGTLANPSRRSLHYRRQSAFKGSDRQIRGKVLKLLVTKKSITKSTLCRLAGVDPVRINAILETLVKDGLIKKRGGAFSV